MNKLQAIKLYNSDKKEYYKKVYEHLLKHNLAFCFTEHGGIIDRKECELNIN